MARPLHGTSKIGKFPARTCRTAGARIQPSPKMDRRPLKSRQQPWASALAKALVRTGLLPNQVSAISILFAGAAGAALAFQHHSVLLLLLAAACIQSRLLCNLLDGMMAVEGGLKSKTGDLFNDIPDRIGDTLVLVGAGYGCGHPTLGWTAAVLAVMTAYLRLLGGALGFAQDFTGIMSKPRRMFWLTVGSVLSIFGHIIGTPNTLLSATLIWITLGTAVTCVGRTMRLAKVLKAR